MPNRKQPPHDVKLTFAAELASDQRWRGSFTIHSHASTSPQLLIAKTLPETFDTQLKAESAADHAARDWYEAVYPRNGSS